VLCLWYDDPTIQFLSIMPASPINQLRVKRDSATAEFIEWYEVYGAKPVSEGGRKRKGAGKSTALMILDCILNQNVGRRDDNSDQVKEILDAYKNKLSPTLQKAKERLTDEDYKKFVELNKKVNPLN